MKMCIIVMVSGDKATEMVIVDSNWRVMCNGDGTMVGE